MLGLGLGLGNETVVCQPSFNQHASDSTPVTRSFELIDVLGLNGCSFRGCDESKHVGAKPACACSQSKCIVKEEWGKL